VGVATANSILAFSSQGGAAFGPDGVEAAISAGEARLRPVIMTVIAMVFGMIPCRSASARRRQNAPLGRAVIGGMLLACVATLSGAGHLQPGAPQLAAGGASRRLGAAYLGSALLERRRPHAAHSLRQLLRPVLPAAAEAP